MKTISKKNLKKQCDGLFSKIIRSKGYCEYCGRSDLTLNCHHIIGRINHALRFDIRNGCCLCVNCHEFSKDSVKNNSPKFIEWLQINRPKDLEYIKSKSNEIAHYTILDYELIYKKLKEEYGRIQEM